MDDSPHCEAARPENDYTLAKASTWSPQCRLLISGCEDPLWTLSVTTPQHGLVLTLLISAFPFT